MLKHLVPLVCVCSLIGMPSYARGANYELTDEFKACPRNKYSTLVEMRINSAMLPDFEEVFVNNDDLWLPVETLVYFAEGRIEKNQQEILITLYGDQNTIRIDLENNLIETPKQQASFQPECLFSNDTHTFISGALLEAYFNLKINYRSDQGYLDIFSGQPLPRDRRIQREAKREKLKRGWSGLTADSFPRNSLPYGIAEGIYTDVDITSRTDTNSRSSTTFNAFTSAEALGLTHTLFTAGDENKVTSARWTARRISPYGDVFGITGLYQAEFGDITDLSSPMVGNSGLGRGIKFQAAPVTLTDNFSSTTIEGDAIPGWDAELYIGGVLRAFQKVDDNGRFNFNEISINYGSNDLVVVLYGPNGEVEKLDYSQVISAGMLPPGQVYTWGSLTQPNRSMLLNNGNTEPLESALNYSIRSDWGVSESLTLSGQAVRQLNMSSLFNDDSAESYDFIGFEARSRIGSINLISGYKKNLQTASNAYYLNTNLPDFLYGVSISYEFADQYFNSNYTGSDSLALRQNILLSTSIPLSDRLGSIFVIGEHRQFQNGSMYENLDMIYGHKFEQLPVTHYLTFNRQKAAGDPWGSLSGTYRGITSYDRDLYSIRGELIASVLPEVRAEQFNLQFIYRKTDFENYSASFSHSFDGDNYLSVGLNREFERFNVSASLSTGPLGTAISTRLGFSFGIAQGGGFTLNSRPTARTARVAINTFNDMNYNSVRDDHEPALGGVDIYVNNRQLEQSTDSNGKYLIENLAANYPFNLEVGKEYLAANFQTSIRARQEIVPRMGRVTVIDIPVVESAFVSGKVYYQTTDGNRFPLSMATVSAIDSAGVERATTISVNNGYFSLEGLVPGDWTLKVSTRRLNAATDEFIETRNITIEPGELDIYDVDFIFTLPE